MGLRFFQKKKFGCTFGPSGIIIVFDQKKRYHDCVF